VALASYSLDQNVTGKTPIILLPHGDGCMSSTTVTKKIILSYCLLQHLVNDCGNTTGSAPKLKISFIPRYI
jgi:hypothetical protein